MAGTLEFRKASIPKTDLDGHTGIRSLKNYFVDGVPAFAIRPSPKAYFSIRGFDPSLEEGVTNTSLQNHGK